jgi:hypothetical protein
MARFERVDKPTPKQRPRRAARFFIDPAMSDEQILDFIDRLKAEGDPEPNNVPDNLPDEPEKHR